MKTCDKTPAATGRRPADIGFSEGRPREGGVGEVSSSEVGFSEGGPAEVRSDILVMLPPRIPHGDASLQDREMLRGRHRACLSLRSIWLLTKAMGATLQALIRQRGRRAPLAHKGVTPLHTPRVFISTLIPVQDHAAGPSVSDPDV